jgi:hypothetical protein
MCKNTQSITWIQQPACKIPKNSSLYFKMLKTYFWQRNIIFTFDIRTKKNL